jgi:hypothetical protein
MGPFYKRIQIEIANAEDIDKVISQYGLLLKKIEEESSILTIYTEIEI